MLAAPWDVLCVLQGAQESLSDFMKPSADAVVMQAGLELLRHLLQYDSVREAMQGSGPVYAKLQRGLKMGWFASGEQQALAAQLLAQLRPPGASAAAAMGGGPSGAAPQSPLGPAAPS